MTRAIRYLPSGDKNTCLCILVAHAAILGMMGGFGGERRRVSPWRKTGSKQT